MRRFSFAVLALTFLSGVKVLPSAVQAQRMIRRPFSRRTITIRRLTVPWQIACASLVCVLFSQSAAAQTKYRFIKIADTTVRYAQFLSAPAINQHGVVAFAALTDKGVREIVTFDDNVMSVVADSSGEFAGFGPVSLNDNNAVAFYGVRDGGRPGIFKISGGAVTTVAEPSSCCPNYKPLVHINNAGTVVFQTRGMVEPGIYAGDGGAIRTIARTGDQYRAFGSAAWIADSGEVAFSAYDIDRHQAIYMSRDSSSDKLAEVAGFDYAQPSVSSNGDVFYFSEYLDAFGKTIAKLAGGNVTTLVSVDGPFAGLHALSTSPDGRFAFVGDLDTGGHGIYTGPDPVKDKVIRTGEELFGSTVYELRSYHGLNERGDIAFRYKLASGVQGVALARVVPEPTCRAIVMAALTLFATRAPGARRPTRF